MTRESASRRPYQALGSWTKRAPPAGPTWIAAELLTNWLTRKSLNPSNRPESVMNDAVPKRTPKSINKVCFLRASR